MDLRFALDLCQEARADAWHRMPSGPAERMVNGLLDVAESNNPPALAALQPDYRAIYAPDARLGLAWGIPDADLRDETASGSPDWMPTEWSSARPAYAVALLNGSAIWQVLYASVNWGAGISGYMPWPTPHYADRMVQRPDIVGWRSTSWEASFARLLTRIAGHREFRSRTEEVAAGMLLEQQHPLDQ